MMTKTNKENIFFAAIFTLVVLWQTLLPGYVLVLDMVFTPRVPLNLGISGFYNDSPVLLATWLLNLFLDGWIVQKIFLISLFFLLAYWAVRFLPVPKKHYANYWAALFYGLNPFVYERFLAGQWMAIFAYACLPPFVHYLLAFFKESSYRGLGRLLFWTMLIGVFSLHFLVMAVLVIAAVFAARFVASFKKKEEAIKLAKFAVVFVAAFLVLSSYWLVPYFMNRQGSVLNVMNTANQTAFKTIGANGLETSFNVLTLYGFWVEQGDWNRFFLSPRSYLVFWSIVLAALAALVIVGVRRAFRQKRGEAYFFAALALAAFVFSCGLGNGPLKGFNAWLFDHVSFWRGFRDTQKWSGLIALAYAYFGGWGFFAITERIHGRWGGSTISTFDIRHSAFNKIIIFLMFCLPVLYTYTMVGGFARQPKAVWYPPSWYQVKEKIDTDKNCGKVLFLPWHQYMSLYFNQNIVSANPAKGFFGSRIVAGDNMEMDGVFSQSTDKENLAIQSIILDEDLTADEAAKRLEYHEISYILVMNKAMSQDYLKYPFLGASRLRTVFRSDDLTLYEIEKYNK